MGKIKAIHSSKNLLSVITEYIHVLLRSTKKSAYLLSSFAIMKISLLKKFILELGRRLSGKYLLNKYKTRVQIHTVHLKSDEGVHICNPSFLVGKWKAEAEAGDSLKAHRLVALSTYGSKRHGEKVLFQPR